MKKTIKGTKRILVTSAGGYAAVGFCNALKRSKNPYHIVCTDADPLKLPFASGDKKYLVPPAGDKNYVDVLNTIIEKNNIEFLHSQQTNELAYIETVRDKIKTKLFIPPHRSFEIANDKFKTHQELSRHKLPVPQSIFVEEKNDIEKAFKTIKGPLWFRAIRGSGGKGSLLIKDKNIAEAWVTYWDGFSNFMASAYLPGKNLGWDCIWKNGELLASYGKERISYALGSSSPSGISGTAGVIRPVIRKDIDDLGKKTILAIEKKPHGAYSVDFKEDANGNPHITEINPGRFLTSSLVFFAETGSNLPELHIKAAFNEEKDEHFSYREDLFLIRSLDHTPIILDKQYFNSIEKQMGEQGFAELT